MPSELHSERRDAALILTISDPATRNTLSKQVVSAAVEALATAETDDRVRAVVVRGAGAHFCAGGNLQGLRERRAIGPQAQRQQIDHLHHLIDAIRAFPKPVVAAVEGAAAGAGFSLAAACDLIVAAEDARFALSYAKVGFSPDGGATWNLARSLPRQRLQRLVWLAETISARELEACGVVGWVSAPGQALDEALRLVARLAELSPNAILSGKELVGAALERSLSEQLVEEREHFVANLFSENGGEGLNAFFEKRPPRFK